jgi:NarL family two-component system response regulator LiaR
MAEAANGREALEICEQLSRSGTLPDVILMDMLMPEMDGIAATEAILEQYPQVQLLALSSFDSGTLVQAALRAGAIGYLLKGATIDELAEAIRSAHVGKSILAPAAARALVEVTRQRPNLGDDLTDRELEVLALVVEGMSNQQIAQQLAISLSTARSHVSTILSKLAAANRAEAAALAVQYGLAIHNGHSYRDTTGQNPDAPARQTGYNGNGEMWDLPGVPGNHL